MADSITLTWTWNPRSGVLSAKTDTYEMYLVEDLTGWSLHVYERRAIRSWAAGETGKPTPFRALSRLTFAEAMDVAQTLNAGQPVYVAEDHPAFNRLYGAVEKGG